MAAVLLLLAGGQRTDKAPELLDFWDDPSGWTTFLNGSSGTAVLGRDVIYPCELVHFLNKDQSIAFVLAEEGSFLSRGFVYLRVVDRTDKRIGDTKIVIAKIDGVTVGNLALLNRRMPGTAEAEIFRLGDFTKTRGRKLQIVTDNAIYEADASALPNVIGDLQACQSAPRKLERR